jgi:hypothetical protein
MHLSGTLHSMNRVITAGSLALLVVAGLAAAPNAGAQVVKRDTTPRSAKKPATRLASVDSLVVCSPVASPVAKKPVARRRVVRRPALRRSRPAALALPKAKVPSVMAPKPPPHVALKRRRPVVRRVKRTTPRAATSAPAHSTTIVMCRPVRPLAPLAQGTPTEVSVIPVPQLATAPALAPATEEGPPLLVSTSPGVPIASGGGGRSWLPFAVIPAIFIPFIHTGSRHHGNTPIDTVTRPPLVPPVDTIPVPPVVPPTTVPEPGSLVMLGSGLLGLAGAVTRRRKR